MNDNRFSRRYFFYGSLLAGAVPAGGFGSQPSLKAMGFKSFNEKLNIACIGLGMRGPQILPGASAADNIVALCDVDETRGATVFEQYPRANRYRDYRRMLDTEGNNLDAVMVAVPDHWHTVMSLECMQRGKHVYCEKPLTRTVWEARLLAEAAVKYGVATQMGNQGFSHEGTKTCCEIMWSGDIGEVREVHSWTRGGAGDRGYPASGPPEQPIPPTLDWDAWLGPAAPRPFNADMLRWRSFQDFSAGGTLGDWLVHCLGPVHLALHLDKAAPISVEAVNVVERNPFTWPASNEIIYEFPARGNMPPVTVHGYQAMRGDFKNPEGVDGDDYRLLPAMGNLAEDKNRAFVGSGDGTLLVGTQLDVRGQPLPRAPRQAPARTPARAAPARAPIAAPAQDRGPGNGSVFVGSKGYMATCNRGEGVWLLPASRWADYRLPPQILPRGVNHQQDWIRACKGGVPGVSDFAVATKYIEWLVLGAVALRVPGKLMWDAANMRFTNNEEANKYLKPYLRQGFELKL